ncbi:hypothetical protein Leryth_015535 [Lithospermum erythrorhizon]|nr:hypothetical protein Leryth_015535 [Lithospermum erythrorhizon]
MKASGKDSPAVPSSSIPVATSGVSRESHSMCRNNMPMLSDGQLDNMQIGEVENFTQTQLLFPGDPTIGTIPQWHLDDILGLSDFNQSYGYMGNDGSSKAGDGKLGDSDDSSIIRASEEELDGDECLGQVPDSHWAVPQVTSPPTASGIYWPKTHQNQPDAVVSVPDICHSPLRSFNRCQPNGSSLKRRRQM